MATQTTGSTADLELEALRASIAADRRGYLADLERLVNIDCGSYTPEGVSEVGRWTARFLEDLGAAIDVRPDPTGRFAETIVATFERKADGPRVLLIGHMDTVFDPGTAAARPFRIDDDTAHGPGVTDMKSGLLAGLYALKAIISEVNDNFATFFVEDANLRELLTNQGLVLPLLFLSVPLVQEGESLAGNQMAAQVHARGPPSCFF